MTATGDDRQTNNTNNYNITKMSTTGQRQHHELSPLLLSQTSSGVLDDDSHRHNDGRGTHTKTAALTSTSADSSSSQSQSPSTPSSSSSSSQASIVQTILNLMKTCMGTGCLALSYSCQQGGSLVYVVGAFTIATWNIMCVHRLCQCLHYIPKTVLIDDDTVGAATRMNHVGDDTGVGATEEEIEAHQQQQNYHDNDDGDDDNNHALRRPSSQTDDVNENRLLQQQQQLSNEDDRRWRQQQQLRLHPPQGISTLGKVAWYAYGYRGLIVMDIMMICLLIGVIVSYVAAAISFLNDTPLSLGSVLNAVIIASIMGFISLVPNIGYLSKFSLIGLIVLFTTILVIAGYGVIGLRREEDEAAALLELDFETASLTTTLSKKNEISNNYYDDTTLIPIWPESIGGVCRWFGVVVFGFGVV